MKEKFNNLHGLSSLDCVSCYNSAIIMLHLSFTLLTDQTLRAQYQCTCNIQQTVYSTDSELSDETA